MKRVSHFSIQPAWRLIMRDLGIHPEDVLRLAGLPLDLFSRKDAVIDARQYFQLWDALELADGSETLPLRIGQAISVEGFDPAIFASLCSPNLNIALQRLSSFKKLIGPMHLHVAMEKAATIVELQCYGQDLHIPASLAVTELVFMTQLVRLGTRYPVKPHQVVLPELPCKLDEYARFFGARPKKGNCIQLSFTGEDAVRPFMTANEAMWDFFEVGLRQRLAKLEETASAAQRVKAALLEGLPAGQYAVSDVARQLAMSTRTLQRLLKDEHTSFSQVLNTTRQQLAHHYLSKPVMGQAEVAYLLGFQDVNAFNKAFKSWEGISPGAYRHRATAAQ